MRSSIVFNGVFKTAALILALSTVAPLWADDTYRDFKDLSLHEKEGIDYQVNVSNRKSPACVLAIHGGRIEEGTQELAEAIAGNQLSFYIFEAKKPEHNKVLHITSSHFDDPRILDLTRASRFCISLHGFKEEEKDVACIGGGNASARDKLAKRLSERFKTSKIEIKTPCTQYGGEDPLNVVNRCTDKGVQIELSTHLRRRLEADPALMSSMASEIRGVL